MPVSQKQYTDNELIKLFHEGRREFAFEQIILKHQQRLYWHIRKIVLTHDDTDDILQNTLLKIWNALENFREDSQLFTWLYRIATNEALNHLKSKKRRSLVPLQNDEYDISETLADDPFFDGDEAQLKLQKALLKVPDKQRIVFNMKYFEDMKYEDISQILNVSVGALKASYHHAVKKIEKYLNEG